MEHCTILEPIAVARLLDNNKKFRDIVRKTLSTQIPYSFDSLLRGDWYDPSIETLTRVTAIAASVMGVDPAELSGVASILAPADIAAWLKENRDKFFAIAHYVDCSRGALYHYEKTGKNTLSFSITAGVSDFIHDQEKIRAKQGAL